jgi:hypothetical protein
MQELAVVIVENRSCWMEVFKKHNKFLPACKVYANTSVNSIQEYNGKLTSLAFWESIKEENILIIQNDSELLRHGLEEFYQWDYVGAPWTFQEHGGNGGLSFRKKSAMIDCIKNVPYIGNVNEDIYFSNALKHLGKKLAPREVCSKFSCEAILKLGTLGAHAIDKWHEPEECKVIRSQYAS